MKRYLAAIFAALMLIPSPAAGDMIARTFAIEAEYGSSNTTPLPPNEIGQEIYGNSIYTNPASGSLVWAPSNKMNVGITYSNSLWKSDKTFYAAGGPYKSPGLTMTSICPFIEFPLFSNRWPQGGIIRGLFAEIGPSFDSLTETYKASGSSSVFASSGVSLHASLGLRTLSQQFLSFIARATVSVPLASDLKKSDTGLTLNGAVTISFNAGACISF